MSLHGALLMSRGGPRLKPGFVIMRQSDWVEIMSVD